MRSVFEQIQALCNERSITPTVVAERVGLTLAELRRLDRRRLSPAFCERLAGVLGISAFHFDKYVQAVLERDIDRDFSLVEAIRGYLMQRYEGAAVSVTSSMRADPHRPSQNSEGERPEFLTIQDAARELSVSVTTVYKLMNDGKLPYSRIGDMRRIRFADILLFGGRKTN